MTFLLSKKFWLLGGVSLASQGAKAELPADLPVQQMRTISPTNGYVNAFQEADRGFCNISPEIRPGPALSQRRRERGINH
jgi:hypothetical protein